MTFNDEGRRDEDDADLELRAAVGGLGLSHQPSSSGLVLAAAHFLSAGFRWKPTWTDIEAALAVHRLHHTGHYRRSPAPRIRVTLPSGWGRSASPCS
ncbi:hypothetical protein [Paraliomyxa miuraensis]|uniref:hypothetical protein n=1 Tax=Paraliomyxa miuraensis TaxID=376150 RepID=UPI002255BC97|nr:hypothetical protein [Paraliomyxa miuraensis]MCX4239434.1 hypothetical protein [Paraliomyxa miuraensis]